MRSIIIRCDGQGGFGADDGDVGGDDVVIVLGHGRFDFIISGVLLVTVPIVQVRDVLFELLDLYAVLFLLFP